MGCDHEHSHSHGMQRGKIIHRKIKDGVYITEEKDSDGKTIIEMSGTISDKSIYVDETCHFNDKQQLVKIEDKNGTEHYEYDDDGNMSRYYTT